MSSVWTLATPGYSKCLPTCLGVVWRMLPTSSCSSRVSRLPLRLLHPWSRSRTWPCNLRLPPRSPRSRSDKLRCWRASCPQCPHPPVSPARLRASQPVKVGLKLVWSGPCPAPVSSQSGNVLTTTDWKTQIDIRKSSSSLSLCVFVLRYKYHFYIIFATLSFSCLRVPRLPDMANQGLIIKVDIISITLNFTQFIKGTKKVYFNNKTILFLDCRDFSWWLRCYLEFEALN